MKWWRKLPGWHRRETAFRDWYIALLDRVVLSSATEYERALGALKCPESVSGYREVRYPKIDAAREMVESELGVTPPKVEVAVQRNVLNAFGTPAKI
jgi:hypothetical protein